MKYSFNKWDLNFERHTSIEKVVERHLDKTKKLGTTVIFDFPTEIFSVSQDLLIEVIKH